MDINVTKSRAMDAIAKSARDQIAIEPVDSLPGPVYDFDPAGWFLFWVWRDGFPHVAGGEYVAVHQESGEVRLLGFIGG